MNLSEELQLRGFIKQASTDDLSIVLDQEKRVVYHGIDPSADSAHAGNFVIWIFLKHLINHGHKVVFLVGGGTGMIGDPKPDAERVLNSCEIVSENVNKIKAQAEIIFGKDQVTFVDNYDWLGQLNLIDFLRNVGKHFTVNELIKKEAIAKRLSSETGLSYTEFAYPLLQAFDYLKLHQDYNCTLQIGGSDQWGNIVAGVDLVRRIKQETVYALTAPLIIDKTTGKKFGKSEGNAVWINPEKTSPYAFYQFWLNTADENVIDYLKLFTFLPLADIEVLEESLKTNPNLREAQKALAKEITVFVHGEDMFNKVNQVTKCLFGEVDLVSLNQEEIALLKENAPLVKINSGTDLVEVLIESGLASSKREARTFTESGAVLVGEEKITDLEYKLVNSSTHGLVLVKRGKKKVVVVEVV